MNVLVNLPEMNVATEQQISYNIHIWLNRFHILISASSVPMRRIRDLVQEGYSRLWFQSGKQTIMDSAVATTSAQCIVAKLAAGGSVGTF
jgi:hypothetical protein